LYNLFPAVRWPPVLAMSHSAPAQNFSWRLTPGSSELFLLKMNKFLNFSF
jgi:hypothetical protein